MGYGQRSTAKSFFVRLLNKVLMFWTSVTGPVGKYIPKTSLILPSHEVKCTNNYNESTRDGDPPPPQPLTRMRTYKHVIFNDKAYENVCENDCSGKTKTSVVVAVKTCYM